MCNRVVQKTVVGPGGQLMVILRSPGGTEWVPVYLDAVFAGPARKESKRYWIKKEGAQEVLVPNVTAYGEKNKTTGTQGWEQLPPGSALEGLLLPKPPGKEYQLVKIVTQPATPEQFERMGNDRAPVVVPSPKMLIWCRVDRQEYPPDGEWVWTSDFKTVRKGKWTFPGPNVPLAPHERGKWEDEEGQPLDVMDWVFLGESPEETPAPPAEHPISKGGIAGFKVEEKKREEEEENWWKAEDLGR